MISPESSQPARLSLADGTTLAYHRIPGSAPGVIFLGGFTSDMTGTKATTLAQWCRQRGQAFIRFDYSGHGASSGRFVDGTIGRWASEALAVLDQLTEGPQILVGSSMGAWLMLLTALARPERIRSLLGLACAADFTRYLLWDRLDPPLQERLRRERVITLPSSYGEPYVIAMDLIEEAARHRLLDRPVLPIHCPVRLIHGMNDVDVPWQTSRHVLEKLASPNVRLILVKDGEHTLSRESDLRLLTRTLGELLDGE
ncbi:MAG TPA: alpha/beta hydrolase [Candidatus Competibacteraceae bacterium]|nr:MAG: alpha/beta hydrolase [Candidatus Competibacteraceae bacterium]HOB61035.1 alpha/beta hydrolase [Candidatus Competibacteraceae bacterium]HQA25813.1 alpha/beta hydrolase [Candidatus Competibacteraceae bacterium]HQD55828.1 alpha/beta hydrolase [Candidatus Competibacteraceae bacterium]